VIVTERQQIGNKKVIHRRTREIICNTFDYMRITFPFEALTKIGFLRIRKSCEKNIFSAPKASKIGDRQVLVEPTMALLWRPLDVLLFRRPKNIFFTTFSTVWDIKL
jgi:hypothetical protein